MADNIVHRCQVNCPAVNLINYHFVNVQKESGASHGWTYQAEILILGFFA
jgi:hypothetical protein